MDLSAQEPEIDPKVRSHHWMEALAVPGWEPVFLDGGRKVCTEADAIVWEQPFLRDVHGVVARVVTSRIGDRWDTVGQVTAYDRGFPTKLCNTVWDLGDIAREGDVVHPLLQRHEVTYNGWRFFEHDSPVGRSIMTARSDWGPSQVALITFREPSWLRQGGKLVERAPGAVLFDALLAYKVQAHTHANTLTTLFLFKDQIDLALAQFTKDADADRLIRTLQKLADRTKGVTP